MYEIFILFYRAVPIGIGKQSCNAAEIHYHKMRLSVLLSDSCAATDNLLEFRHRVNHFV